MAFQAIGVVGLPGSGKTEVAKAIAGFGIPSIRMGDVVWEELKRRGQQISEENVGKVSNELRKIEGKGAIARLCVSPIETHSRDKPAVVVDGIRGLAEVNVFRDKFGKNFHLIAVWAGEDSRFLRISSRKRDDDPTLRKDFHEKDLRELSWGLGNAIALSDFMIINDGKLEELHGKVMTLFKKILEG